MALGHSLFRRQAIEFQRGQREFGDVALLQPVSTGLLAWLLTGIAVVAIVFLFFAQFSRKQTAPGYLAPAAGTMKVFPKREGVASAVYVRLGQQVRKDEPLFAVATSQIAANGEDINAAKLTELRHQKELVLERIAGEKRDAAAQRARTTVTIASTRSEIIELQAQAGIQAQRVTIARSLVASAQELLAKGYMSAVESRRREDSLLQQQQNVASLNREIADKQNALATAQYTLKALPTETARKIQPLRDQISQIEQRIADDMAQSAYVVRAPSSGQVSMLEIAPGKSVQLQQPQLEIVPDNSPLRAELLIPTRAAGFVQAGQEVRLLYDAFPYQNYGAFGGHIEQISHSVLTQADLPGPLAPKEPVYKAVVVLDRPEIEVDGRKVALRPGMLLNAEIILDRRSLAAWIYGALLHRRM